ncbi:hypothetical protein ABZY09_36955 [Streptomyces sp. NPDC002928]|uniref:hypothetical protein n=1 Tax=Streptomyces sp. NPDC002928 TaxID=3154440 RepID=UPI0033AC818C
MTESVSPDTAEPGGQPATPSDEVPNTRDEGAADGARDSGQALVVQEQPSYMDDVVSVIAPDAFDSNPRRRNRKLVIAALFMLGATFLGACGDLLLSAVFAKEQAEIASGAEDKVAREGDAFSFSVEKSSDFPEAAMMNRLLSRAEIAKLSQADRDALGTDGRHLLDYVVSLGGVAGYSSNAYAIMGKKNAAAFSEEWLIRLVSDRSVPLIITDITPVQVKCTPAKAVSLVTVAWEGGGSTEGVFFDLTHKHYSPQIANSGEEHFGDSFFRYKTLELGNGQSSIGLRVGVSGGSKDCAWKSFRVTYSDTTGTFHQDITNGSKGFFVHGVDQARIRQESVVTIKGVEECAISSPGVRNCKISKPASP